MKVFKFATFQTIPVLLILSIVGIVGTFIAGIFMKAGDDDLDTLTEDDPPMKAMVLDCKKGQKYRCYEAADSFNEKGHSKLAYKFWNFGCELKDGASCRELVQFQKNPVQIRNTYHKACYLGDVEACEKAARLSAKDGNDILAEKYLYLNCKFGNKPETCGKAPAGL